MIWTLRVQYDFIWITNGLVTFRTLMDDAFRDLLDICVIGYMNDILAYTKSLEEHEQHLRRVPLQLREHQLNPVGGVWVANLRAVGLLYWTTNLIPMRTTSALIYCSESPDFANHCWRTDQPLLAGKPLPTHNNVIWHRWLIEHRHAGPAPCLASVSSVDDSEYSNKPDALEMNLAL